MEVRQGANARDVKGYDTERLRNDFLIQNLFPADDFKLVYSQIDRIIVGGCMPVNKELTLEAGSELKAAYFLERREMGIFNCRVATVQLSLMVLNISLNIEMVFILVWVLRRLSSRARILLSQLSSTLTQHQHIRHILQYLLIQKRISRMSSSFSLVLLKDVISVLTEVYFTRSGRDMPVRDGYHNS